MLLVLGYKDIYVDLGVPPCHGGKICVPIDFREMPFGSGGVDGSVPCQV